MRTGQVKSLLQLLQLTVLLPLWIVLAFVVVIAEAIDWSRREKQARSIRLNGSQEQERKRPARQEVVLTTRAAQV
jgi:hypothetical protein